MNLEKLSFKYPENILIMNINCGNVVIELMPEISPNAVKKFKTLVSNKEYDDVAFYRVVEGFLVQAGDLEFGKRNNLKIFDLWGREPGKGFTKFKEGYKPSIVEFIGTWDLPTSSLYYPYRLAEKLRWIYLKGKGKILKSKRF